MIIRSCWSPWKVYDNTRQGSHAVAAYCLVMNILAIAFTIYQVPTTQWWVPDMPWWGLVPIAYFALFAGFTIMMSSGVKRELRFMMLPWMIYNFIFFVNMLIHGTFLLRDLPVIAPVILGVAALHYYCHLCVYSQYQLIKSNQKPVIEVYYAHI